VSNLNSNNCTRWLALAMVLLSCASIAAQENGSGVVDRTSKMELISTEFGMADGAAWDGFSLLIPDVKGEKLFRYTPTKDKFQTVLAKSGRLSATYFNHGRLFLSDNQNGEIAFLDGQEKVTVAKFDEIKQPNEKPYRPNDLVVDQQGGMYVTFTPQSKVIYVGVDGTQVVAVENIKTPNGITISPDEKTLYVSSFVPKQLWAYDITGPGQTANGRRLASMDPSPERGADGMTVDRAGNVYCTGPKHVWIWSPSGKLIEKLACPTKPINCTFGDQDMRTLYITGPGGLYRQRMMIPGRSAEPASLELLPESKHPKTQPAWKLDTKCPADVKANLNVVFAQVGERKLLADIFVPESATAEQQKPGVIVVHGGGWKNGDKTKFRALAIELTRRGYVVAAIEYRLSSESAFPAAAFDCSAAVRFLRANSDKYFVNAEKIGAVGGSAGGHLTGLMASGGGNPKLQGDGGNADHSAQIQASIVMAGPMEMTTGSVAERSVKLDSNANVWLRGSLEEKPELYRLADAHLQIDTSTCPILFLVGEHDNPSRNEPSRIKLKSLGIETSVKIVDDAKHGCWNRMPYFESMVEEMDVFLSRYLKD
jgi:gluconolactonase